MTDSWTAGPGEMDYDIDHDEDDDYNDARCDVCGAAPDESCTDECDCDDCRGEEDEDDVTEL